MGKAGENEVMTESEDVEENSGVDAPGQSMEPLISSSITFEEKDLSKLIYVIEVATPKFAFRFKKEERVHVGKCEFCSQKNILPCECVCKRVRYCDKDCKERDERFHLPYCVAEIDGKIRGPMIKP